MIKGKNTKLIASLVTLLMVLGVISNRQVNAQFSDSSGFHFNNSFLGARSSAMANTQVSDAHSLEAVYTNPASFLFSESNATMMASAFYSHNYNVMLENITGVIVRDNQHMLAFGATVQHNGLGQALPFSSSENIRFTQYELSVQYASMVSSTFSIGGGMSGAYGMTEQASDWAVVSNFGLFYAPSSSISYGLSYSGLGGSLNNLGGGLFYSYEGGTEGETSENNGMTILSLERMPHRLEIGTTFRFPTISRQPNLKLSFANEKIFGEPGLVYKGGLEVYPVNMLALRGGYLFSPFAQGGRLGFGLSLGSLTMDYAFSETIIGLKGNAHLFNITYNFSN